MNKSVCVQLFISKKNGGLVSLEETQLLRGIFNQVCNEHGFDLWQIATEETEEYTAKSVSDESLFCSEHQCEMNLVDYEDGSRYECPECQRERGETLGLR